MCSLSAISVLGTARNDGPRAFNGSQQGEVRDYLVGRRGDGMCAYIHDPNDRVNDAYTRLCSVTKTKTHTLLFISLRDAVSS